jgi:ABC-type transport system involved in multi-copper enzyme maturation permease subunit
VKALVIAWYTFSELVRRKFVLISLALSFLLLLGLGMLAKFLLRGVGGDIGQGDMKLVELAQFAGGIQVISLFGVFITLFAGMTAIPQEVERRTTFMIFSRPVSRVEFIVGKYFGVTLVAVVNLAAMAVLALWQFRDQEWENLRLLINDLSMMGLSLMVLSVLIVFFSCFMHGTAAAILAVCLYQLGKQPAWVLELTKVEMWPPFKVLVWALFYALPPKVNWLNYHQGIYDIAQRETNTALLVVPFYIVGLLLLSSLIFSRKEL